MSIWKALISAWSSRKLWAFFFTVGIVWAGFERSANYICALPTDKGGFIVTLSVAAFGIIGAAAGAYMGFQSRYSADSVASALSETLTKVGRAPKTTSFDDLDD